MDYVADFETTTNPADCRVWAWAVCEIENPDSVAIGNEMKSFIDFCRWHGGTYHFHNLAFDGEFIINELFRRGFEHSSKGLRTKTFETLISNTGKFYSMQVCFKKQGKHSMESAEFKDSLKKLPMSVDAIAKAFKLPISKLEIDYEAYREPGHELTHIEREYIAHDVKIVAMALKHQFAQGLTKLTIGSDALTWYKEKLGKKRWKTLFPVLTPEMDADIRKAYRGGFTYAAPQFQADDKHPNRIWGAGSVYDVNSLYPDVMYNRPLPIGEPVYFKGEYVEDAQYPLYIQFLTVSCTLKKDHIPTLQIKNNPFYAETQYLSSTEGFVDLALTSVDLELLRSQYDVTVESYNGGYKFRQATGLFKDYIDYWMHIKATTTGGMRTLAKLMLNSLYGKFATNPDVTPKEPYLKDDGSVGYKLGEEETRDPVYTAMGCFITAWARYKTITTAQAVYPRFMYADTDSIHVLGQEPVENIEVHPTNLGAWKHESDFTQAKYVRAKTYIERICAHGVLDDDGNPIMEPCNEYDDVKCAGMPAKLKEEVTFDNFKRGLRIHGKLRPKHVPGGIVLERTDFTLT